MTPDMWHETHGGGVNILSKCQFPSSNVLGFMISWRLGGKGWMNEWMNDLMINKGYCRTAPGTPGLLIMVQLFNIVLVEQI